LAFAFSRNEPTQRLFLFVLVVFPFSPWDAAASLISFQFEMKAQFFLLGVLSLVIATPFRLIHFFISVAVGFFFTGRLMGCFFLVFPTLRVSSSSFR